MILSTHTINVKRVMLKLFMCLFFFSVSAQNTLPYRLRLSIEKGDLKSARITITKNGKSYKVIDTKAKYDLEFDLGQEYVITASKIGYITKSIVVDTKVPTGREESEFSGFESEITLQPQPSEDIEITYTQPVGRIQYSSSLGDFDFDKDYTAKALEMQKKANAKPSKKNKTVKDSIVSNPEKIEKTVEITKETNKPIEKIKPETPPLTPSTRNVVETFAQQDKLKITYRAVTINGIEIIYRKEEFSWGGVYFYKGTINIIESTFETDTK